MGCLTILTEQPNKFRDHLAHLVVFTAIAIINITLLYDHPDSRIITAVSAVALGTSLTSALYHLGLSIVTNGKEKKAEMESGKALRNLLTTLTLVFVAVGLGVKQKLLDITILEADAGGNADHKQMNLLMWQFILLVIARFLDVFFDVAETSLFDVAEIQCDKKEEEKCLDVFTGRILVTHALLLAATIMTGMLTEGDDKLEGLSDNERMWLIITLVLLIVHTGLYPLVYILGMGGILDGDDGTFKMCCGQRKEVCNEEQEGRKWNRVRNYVKTGGSPQYTLESLNRVPLIRTLVSTIILCVISILTGHTLQNARAQLVVIVLTLYVAADAIGRNVV